MFMDVPNHNPLLYKPSSYWDTPIDGFPPLSPPNFPKGRYPATIARQLCQGCHGFIEMGWIKVVMSIIEMGFKTCEKTCFLGKL